MAQVEIAVPHRDEKPRKVLGIRHFQLTLMFLTGLIFYGHRTCLSVAIIAMTEETPPDPSIPTYPDWDNTDTILSSFFWGYIIPQVAAGQLGEYFGPKWFLVITMVLGSITNILIPTMAEALGQTGVMLCRIFQGLNQAFLFPSLNNLMSRWTPLYERSTVSGIIYAGSALGIVASMLITGQISGSNFGWPTAFYFYGGIGIAWALVFAVFSSNSPSVHRGISEEEKAYIEGSNSVTQKKKKIPTPWRAIATSLPVWAVFITSCGQCWGTFTLMTEIPSYMSNIMDFDIKSNSELSALPYAALFFMDVTGAPLADKLISSGTFSMGTTRKICNGLGTFLPAAALFSLGFLDGSHKNLATALLVVAVGCTALTHYGSIINTIDLAPNHAGTLFAICNGFSNIFSILGPLAVEFSGDDKEDPILWKKVFWLASLIYVCCGLFYVVFASGEVQSWNDNETSDDSRS